MDAAPHMPLWSLTICCSCSFVSAPPFKFCHNTIPSSIAWIPEMTLTSGVEPLLLIPHKMQPSPRSSPCQSGHPGPPRPNAEGGWLATVGKWEKEGAKNHSKGQGGPCCFAREKSARYYKPHQNAIPR